MKTLKEIMREGFIFAVQRTAPVSVAARVMETHNVGIVAVLEGTRLVGVFSERDVVRRVVNRGRDPETTPVEVVMTREMVVAAEDEDYQSAMRKIDHANIRHLPIVNGDRLVSMLSIRDLMRVDMARMSEEIAYLHEYLYQVPK
ncbi:MAG: CBS domain-containing protein [Deltaproteobacteria bacterium]|nr:CBS domain-containing protein [Deltaproteobacteria bacterium]